MPNNRHTGPYLGPQGPVPLSERQRIAQAVVGVVAWGEDGSWGYCACPGADLHNGKTARRDCRVFTGLRGEAQESPNVYCLHTSCLGAIEAASTRLRSLIGKAKVAAARPLPPTPPSDPRNVRPVRHTARTGNFGLAEESGVAVNDGQVNTSVQNRDSHTARTDENRPLTRFARARTHPHVLPKVPFYPSEPYIAAKPAEQPKAQPAAPKVNCGPVGPREVEAARVFCPVRLVWITREQWAQELAAKPLKP